jgi:hypothetical protein
MNKISEIFYFSKSFCKIWWFHFFFVILQRILYVAVLADQKEDKI